MYAIVEITGGRLSQGYDYTDRTKEDTLVAAAELAMEAGYEYGRGDAWDILQAEGVIAIGDTLIYVVELK